MLARSMGRAVGVATLLAAIALAACSSSSSSSKPICTEDPFECAAGTTCWSKDTTTYECLPSGAGKPGDSCTAVAGSPPCGDGLICLQTPSAGGKCVHYCDPTNTAHGCAKGSCALAMMGQNGPQTHVCAGE